MKKPQSEILIYQTPNKTVEVKLNAKTLWLDAHKISEIFDVDRTVVVRHLKNIYKTEELQKISTCVKIAQVAADGKKHQMDNYNLDAIIAVGYRVNSKRATQFRIWATSILKDHLTKGFTINRQRFEENAKELETALELVRKAAKSSELNFDSSRGLVDVISRYTQTFLILQRYDEGLLTEPKAKKGGRLPNLKEVRSSLENLKKDLILRKQATDLFARERGDALAAILGNLEQTVFGKLSIF